MDDSRRVEISRALFPADPGIFRRDVGGVRTTVDGDEGARPFSEEEVDTAASGRDGVVPETIGGRRIPARVEDDEGCPDTETRKGRSWGTIHLQAD